MTSETVGVRRVAAPAALLLSVFSWVAVGVAWINQYLDVREIDSQCGYNIPEGVNFTERGVLVADGTFFPAGRMCLYEAMDGGTVTTQTGWFVSVVAAVLTISAIIAFVIALRKGTTSPRVMKAAGAFIALAAFGWILIGFTAAQV